MTVVLTGFGTYVPEEVLTGAEVAERSGVPEDVVVEKMGLVEKHVCPPDEDHASDMCVKAGRAALADAGIAAGDVDLVLYHGSEYKDYVVWSAAAHVAERLGAEAAYATESHTLCAGAPVAFRQVGAQLRVGDLDRALLVTASREGDLIDYANEDSSFMFNFGSGASAAVLERADAVPPGGAPDAGARAAASGDAGASTGGDGSAVGDDDSATGEDGLATGGGDSATGERAPPAGERARARVLESAALTDGSFAEDVVMPAGGSLAQPSRETVDAGLHSLDVPDHESMKERLAEVSLPNFLAVADGALERSGYDRGDVDFAAIVHVKRSFHEALLDALGLGPEGGYYLEEYGHVQSADQVLALERGLAAGRVEPGDVVLFLAAGTGYTWAATVLDWLG